MNPTMNNQSNMMRSSPRFSLLRCMTACLFLSRCISHVDGFNNVGNSRLPAALMASKPHTQNRSSSAFSTPLESSSLSPSPHSHRPSTSKLFAMQSQSNIHNNGGGVLFPRKQYAISTSRRSAACGTNQKKNAILSFSRSMNLSKLQMTVTSDSSKDNDNDNAVNNGGAHRNPLVKVWLQLRKMFARLWSILICKPIQLVKSTFTKDAIKEKGNTTETLAVESVENQSETEAEKLHEDVVITEIENLAVEEEEVGQPTVLVEDARVVEPSVEVASPPATTSDDASVATTATTTTFESTEAVEARQATSSPKVNLSGNWTIIVDDAFKSEYDEYLRKLGQPMLVRTVASTVIGSTKEETRQMDSGRELFIKGSNVRGSWERTLEASEATVPTSPSPRDHAVEGHVLKPMITADEEEVEVASWWENDGTVHKSWVVGGKKYGGGDFENRRYLKDNGNILVCESTFHPNEEGREKACVTWRFLREGAIYGEPSVDFPNIFDVFGSEEDKKKKKQKKEEEESKEAAANVPTSRMVVGDILDDVTTSEEANGLSTSSKIDIEAEIERESWVPPIGDRWAIAAPETDLSGKWKLIITEKFKEEYDEFLTSLGQPVIVRGAAVVLIGNTREETKQTDNGRLLFIKGINAKGIWERTLTSSGSDFDTAMTPAPDGTYDHLRVPIVTADSEHVLAESWWENDGTAHVSWTIGVKKYGGGSFESKRYLENNGDVYVCESTFHPDDNVGRKPSFLKWKFIREGATFFLGQ